MPLRGWTFARVHPVRCRARDEDNAQEEVVVVDGREEGFEVLRSVAFPAVVGLQVRRFDPVEHEDVEERKGH